MDNSDKCSFHTGDQDVSRGSLWYRHRVGYLRSGFVC